MDICLHTDVSHVTDNITAVYNTVRTTVFTCIYVFTVFTMLFKIVKCNMPVEADAVLLPADPRTRSHHSFKFKHIQSHTCLLYTSDAADE